MALEVSLIREKKNDWGDYAQLEGAGQPVAEVVTSPGTVEEMDYLQNLSLTWLSQIAACS